MKIYLPLVILLLVACAPKEQKSNIVSETKDTITINETANEEAISTETIETALEPLEIKSLVDNDFKNTDKLIHENEFGGGDCFGTYQQNNVKEKSTTTTSYGMSCGEYGFTNYRLVSSEDNTPLFLEKINYENDMSGEAQVLEEWIINFQDTSKVFYRKHKKENYEMKTIPNDIEFTVYEGNSLNISEGLSIIESGKTEALHE